MSTTKDDVMNPNHRKPDDPSNKENALTSRKTWWRIPWMILFGVIYGIADVVIIAITILQLLLVLFTGERNERLANFSASLANYLRDLLRFVMFNSEDKPFPFADWPRSNA